MWDHIRGRINTSVEFLWCIWCWVNKSYRLRRAEVQMCDVWCSHWLAALGYCWARLKMEMCKFKELQEPQEWKHSWVWHTNFMIASQAFTCFLLQEHQIKWAQKAHLFKCLIYTILLFGIFSTCILQKSPQLTESLHQLLLLASCCFSSPALRRETDVKRWITVIKRSNWK